MSCLSQPVNDHDAIDVVELFGTFTDAQDVPFDPPVVKCLVKHSHETTKHAFVFGVDSNLERTSTGAYKCSVQPIELKPVEPAGLWLYGFIAEDPGAAVEERDAGGEEWTFNVRESSLF